MNWRVPLLSRMVVFPPGTSVGSLPERRRDSFSSFLRSSALSASQLAHLPVSARQLPATAVISRAGAPAISLCMREFSAHPQLKDIHP
jgi:hypothetical protein